MVVMEAKQDVILKLFVVSVEEDTVVMFTKLNVLQNHLENIPYIMIESMEEDQKVDL